MAAGWEGVTGALARVTDVQWSVRVLDAVTRQELYAVSPDLVLPTASVGKLLLLLTVAAQLEAGELTPAMPLLRAPEDAVADSGLWQHMTADELSVHDLATFVGAVSDNYATNVLLRAAGLDAVDRVTAALGLKATRLHDRVRDHRTAQDPPTLSEGTAGELANLMAELHHGEALGPEVSERVLGWLAAGADLSMVPEPLHLDPLAHADGDRGVRLWHKTGTDDGTRADVGLLQAGERALAWAALCLWDPAGPDRRDDALAVMHAIGAALREQLGGALR
ncbi:serine hydrolase [Oryzihumus leptocrescens]|uniref:Beta-lactamase class A n=1 Tax=Oryzihumus leptocrescens TaxID=297536 RepID=A0A542ZKQ0_9MICO|nr:serine hydrolase [Oryzihumus leptocrescens]TQL60916.1 beta-lactamase class A [Oryzihumus leptocrescens]